MAANTSFVDIEGYKQTPPELSDDDGCMLKRDLKNALNSENASVKSERYGSIMSPTAGKDHDNQAHDVPATAQLTQLEIQRNHLHGTVEE